MIKFISINNDPVLASSAETAGVSRIFVDLERIGKPERQGHLDTLISTHSIDDIAPLRKALTNAELIVRLNPMHAGSSHEIEEAIGEGADILMLPMFRSAAEVVEFTGIVDHRVKTIPLVETCGAVDSLNEIVNIPGVSEIYIGLNDLHLDMGLNFMFAPLADGLIDTMVETIKLAGLPFGFGGIARLEEGAVPAELVLSEHARLGSSSVILSRTFNRHLHSDSDSSLMQEITRLKSTFNNFLTRGKQQIDSDRDRFKTAVKKVVESRANEAPG